MEDVGLLANKLVIGLVVGAFSQLGLLFTRTILELGTDKAIQLEWIVLDRDLGDKWPLWWTCLEHYGAFGR